MPKTILGIITARGGSKGIPRKNVKELAGKPLIAYTIKAAKESGVISRLILSTDDREIANVAKQCGAEVPFMRPAELAQDTTPHLPVLQHAVNWLRDNENFVSDYVMILQPTCPLRQDFHIRESAELMEKINADSIVSVSEIPQHFNPHWQFLIDAENHLQIFTGEPFSQIVKRRQELGKTYTRNGAIYLFKTELLFRSEPTFYGDDVRAYPMEQKYSVNIDSMEDWEEAEKALLRHNR
ncbi:MAG: acylneuraminate cytidylyltransferase family protein [Candidatus Sungbacteria bacterium]|nr:acylneuraminate cytidylyltransferase family protein [Candidatus Sungbacteria bacterium]